jgi:hypothetical protein
LAKLSVRPKTEGPVADPLRTDDQQRPSPLGPSCLDKSGVAQAAHTARLNGQLDGNLVGDATAAADRVRDELARDKQRVRPRLASHTGEQVDVARQEVATSLVRSHVRPPTGEALPALPTEREISMPMPYGTFNTLAPKQHA